MSNDLESDVRRVLRASTIGVAARPDEADVAKRVTGRRRRRRLALAGSGIVATACVVVGLVIIAGRDDTEPIGPAASPTTVASVAETSPPTTTSIDPAMCEPSSTVPFNIANPSDGWTIGPLSPVAHVAAWSYSNGIIEVWNGIRDDLPVPDHVDRSITVLGQQVGIGPISDGYSLVVDLGPTRCERWAIVAHPSVTEAELQKVAEGLTLLPAG